VTETRGPTDARSDALADYLREAAAAFGVCAEMTGLERVAVAGMALLDAADLAQELPPDARVLRVLSEAGFFETMPDSRARFLAVPEMRAAVLRPLVAEPQGGPAILAGLVTEAERLAGRPPDRGPA
jgi:hypothetical protein